MHKFVPVAAAVVFAAGLSAAPAQHVPGGMHGDMHGQAPADTREPVRMPPALVEHTLANMRDHLLTLQQIQEHLARGDTGAAARVAEARLGMSSLELHGAAEVAKYMPKGMQDAGTNMHRAASRFATVAMDAGVSGDMKPVFGALAGIAAACNGCHAGYRLR